MDDDTKLIVAFVLFFVVFIGGIVVVATADNESTWERTEDPACYLHIHKNHHVLRLEDSTVSRTRYCRA